MDFVNRFDSGGLLFIISSVPNCGFLEKNVHGAAAGTDFQHLRVCNEQIEHM